MNHAGQQSGQKQVSRVAFPLVSACALGHAHHFAAACFRHAVERASLKIRPAHFALDTPLAPGILAPQNDAADVGPNYVSEGLVSVLAPLRLWPTAPST
jgi:hypothetical protein